MYMCVFIFARRPAPLTTIAAAALDEVSLII
jgi:hypothetical protein